MMDILEKCDAMDVTFKTHLSNTVLGKIYFDETDAGVFQKKQCSIDVPPGDITLLVLFHSEDKWTVNSMLIERGESGVSIK